MAQNVRIKEMEDYIKKIGELLNVVYKKISEVESKVNSLEAEITKLKGEIVTMKAENLKLVQNIISKQEYEEFMTRLVKSLYGVISETPQTGTTS